MFRALTRPFSGGKIVFTQHLVTSLSVNVCTVHRLRASNSIYCDDHSYNVITVVKHSLFPDIVPLICIEGVKVGIQTFILVEVDGG
jgi:hypothetical protein